MIKKQKKALILWYTIDSNFGDYYIYETIKQYLLDWNYNVINLDIGLPWHKIAKTAKKCDLLWFAGGGIIERWIPDVITNFERFHKKTKFLNYGITGLSIGEFNYDKYRNVLSYWVNNSKFFYSRDDYTASVLNRYSNSKKVIPSVDVVFACKSFQINLIRDLVSENKNYVGINFRDLPYVDLSGEFNWLEWCRSIKNSIAIETKGIPDQYDYSTKVDFDVIAHYSPANALAVLMNSKFNIAMRYHVLLMSARLGIPCVPICYCPKVSRLSDQLGLAELNLGVHDYNRIKEKVDYLIQHFNDIQKNLNSRCKEMELQAEKMFLEIHSRINLGVN